MTGENHTDAATDTKTRASTTDVNGVEAIPHSVVTLTDVAEDGLSDLYRSHYDRLVRVAYAILGSTQAAEDAVQDAYVEVYRRWKAIDNAPAYLRRAVVNRATSVVRRRILEQRHARPGPDYSLDAHDDLRDAVMKLPVKYRAALVLRFYEDLPDDEIAAALGVKRATVRSLVHRGVEQLREVIR